MTIPVLLTKVILPHRRDDILTRPRLVDSLDRLLEHKLVVISAPPGYGKTSLLVDYARRADAPICWYALDENDQDIYRFLTHFVASIEQRFSSFGQQSRAALMAVGNGDIAMEHLVVTIVNEIYNCIQDHFVIVLDDYHLVNSSETVSSFLNQFLQDVDQNCHVVVLTRAFISLPDLPLLVARGEAGGFGFIELAFRADEIRDLMLQNYQQVVPLAVAKDLEQRTEGWITGLLLSAHTMWQGMVDRLSVMRASGAGLYDYLIHQVLDQQPDEVRRFLLRTSFFEEFNAEMCEALLGQPAEGGSWQAVMKSVIKNNLFAVTIGAHQEWLRYHHLFRDFLQTQFAQELPEEIDGILRSMVEVYSSRQEWERAYAICLRLGDIDHTASFLKKVGEPMVRSGRISLLGSWLETLPETVIDEHPALMARKGIILATQGDTTAGLVLLDRAVEIFRSNHNKPRLAGTLVWRAFVYYTLSNTDDSLVDAAETLSLTEKNANDSTLIRFKAEAHRILGQNYRMLGQLEKAIHNFNTSLEIHMDLGDEQGANLVRLGLGAIFLDNGDFTAALSCFQLARDYYQEQGNLIYLAAVLNDVGFVQHLRGEFEEAFATYEHALAKVRVGGIARVQMLILVGIGDLFVDLSALESASEAFTKARELLNNVSDHFLTVYLTLAEAGVARMKGDLPQAHLLLESAKHISKGRPSNYTRGLIFIESGQQAYAKGAYQEAISSLTVAAQLFDDGGQLVLAGRANLLLANIYYESGDIDAATGRLHKAFELVSGLEGQNILLPVARNAKSLLESFRSSSMVGKEALFLYERVMAFEKTLPELRHSLRFTAMTIPFSPPKLRIQGFGETKVLVNERLVLGGERQTQDGRDLLFLLLSKPRGLTKEAIADLLWPGSQSEQHNTYFKNAAYRLRRVLQQDVIRFDGGLYYFNWGLDYEYDVDRLLELREQSRDTHNKEDLKPLYQEILNIYTGKFLPDASGVWAQSERERLRQIFISAGLQLSHLYMESAQYDLALDVCCRLMDEDHCLEEAYCIAMQAHAAIGNKSAIVREYENLKAILKVELDGSPSPQTESLFSSLLH